MAMLWELVCYVNGARVTLMGRVKALEEMRRDGSGQRKQQHGQNSSSKFINI